MPYRNLSRGILTFSHYSKKVVRSAAPVLENELTTAPFKKIIQQMVTKLKPNSMQIPGLVAPQINVAKRIIVLSTQQDMMPSLYPFLLLGQHKPIVCFINPVILAEHFEHALDFKTEPSLSQSNMCSILSRPNGIMLHALSVNNDLKSLYIEGAHARKIHYLVDLLDGRQVTAQHTPIKNRPR